MIGTHAYTYTHTHTYTHTYTHAYTHTHTHTHVCTVSEVAISAEEDAGAREGSSCDAAYSCSHAGVAVSEWHSAASSSKPKCRTFRDRTMAICVSE